MNASENNSAPIRPSLHQFSRLQAISDGLQIEITNAAAKAGIPLRVFITRAVHDQCVAVPAGVISQASARRLHNLAWRLRFAMGRAPRTNDVSFGHEVRNSDSEQANRIALLAVIGATDIDDPSPAITIMLGDED